MATTRTVVPMSPQHYVWWFPGSPVKVHLNLRVVQQLRDRLASAAPGTAEEGILFGRMLDGAAEILDFLPASNSTVPNMIAALSNEQSERSLIGYYRTEEGETFHLNAKDLSLAEECFRKPYHVFLMIHSNGFGSPNATFFFHNSDRKMADFAFLEFPFDPSLLALEERERIQRSHSATPELAVEPSVPAPDSSLTVRPNKGSGLLHKSVLWTCSIALVLASGVLVNNRPFREWTASLLRTASHSPAVGSPSLPALALHAKRQNGDLELTWSRESAVIAAATSGAISIQDGSSKRQVALDSTQIRSGSLLYSPTSDQILMQLTVATPTGDVTESVMVVLPAVGSPQTYPVAAPKPSATLSAAAKSVPNDSVPLSRASKPFTEPSRTASTQPPPALTDSPPLKLTLDPAVVAPAFASQTPAPPPMTPVAPVEHLAPLGNQPAVAIAKTVPVFPPELHTFAVKRTVIEVKVIIEKNGKVSKAEAIPQKNTNQFLINAAVNAARLWKFQPALHNNEAVSSELVLQFIFDR